MCACKYECLRANAHTWQFHDAPASRITQRKVSTNAIGRCAQQHMCCMWTYSQRRLICKTCDQYSRAKPLCATTHVSPIDQWAASVNLQQVLTAQ